MSWYTLVHGAQDTLLIVGVSIIVSALFAAIVAGSYRALSPSADLHTFPRIWLEVFFIALPFGVVGIASGFLTGVSRSPAVSALVPSALTLFGGLVAYLMSRGITQALLAAVAVVTFSATLLLGTISGSLMRQDFEASENSIQKGYREAERELAVSIYRKSLGLPPEPKIEKKRDE